METIISADKAATLFINSVNSPGFDTFFYLVSSKYTWFCVGVGLLFFLFKKAKPNYRTAIIFLLFLAVAILCADQLCNLVKHSAQRFRPCWDESIMDSVHIVNNDRGGKYGFFSAHAATFFALAFMTAQYFKNKYYTIGVYFIALLVSYSRIYLGRHFLGDIFVGAIEGTLIAWGVMWFYHKFLTKYNAKHGIGITQNNSENNIQDGRL
ncbi:MAG: phosphatase PAP2 family protein [Bacteroidales bacterium]|nr:phosphatase PAP2 family protein [Bacteroidales bacterium]